MAMFGSGMQGYGMFGSERGIMPGMPLSGEIGWAEKIGALLQDLGANYNGQQGRALPMLGYQQQRLGDQKKYQEMLGQLSAPGTASVTNPTFAPAPSAPGSLPQLGPNREIMPRDVAPGPMQVTDPGSLNSTAPGPLAGSQFAQMLPLLQVMDPERGIPLAFNAMQDQQKAANAPPEYRDVGGALYELPRTADGKPTKVIDGPMKAPTSRTIRQGSIDITQEFQPDGTWKEVARGNAWQPSQGGSGRENWGQPVTESGPDGKPVVVRYGSNGGRMVVDGASPKPQSRAPGTRMVDGLVKVGTNLENLERLNTTFKPEYAGNYVLGGAENFLRRNKPGGDPSGQAQWWQDYQTYVNQVRNDLFGAALTPGEKSEFEKSIVTPRMSPEEAKKNMDRQTQISTRAAQRQSKAYVAMGYDKEAIEGALGYGVDDLARKQTPLANPQGQAQSQQPVRVSSDAEYDRLPSGAVFVGPDGKQRKKP
jgi:hypothetical protein